MRPTTWMTAWLLAAGSCTEPERVCAFAPDDGARVTVGDLSFERRSTAIQLYGSTSPNAADLEVRIGGDANECAAAKAGDAGPSTWTGLIAWVNGARVDRFDVRPFGEPGAWVAVVRVSADAGAPHRIDAVSGSLTVESFSRNWVAGRFDVTFATGEHLSGRFDAPTCDAEHCTLR